MTLLVSNLILACYHPLISLDILSVIHEIPNLSAFLNSFYSSDYAAFFVALAAITDHIKTDRYVVLQNDIWSDLACRYLSVHAKFLCREMRVKAYSQLLESYSSVKLTSLAAAFGVSVDFVDRELARFVAAGRIHCKIDKVNDILVSYLR